MTGLGEDSHKHKSNDAARYLAESFFGLNMNPTDVGGEVLFDDYDDTKSAIEAGASSQNRPTDRAEVVEAFSNADSGNSSVDSAPNRFEENLDDLIVFSDDDDDENDAVDDEDEEEEDDENFDFGEEDEDEDEEEDCEDDDEEDDDEEDEDEEEELDDADLDFGDDVIVPAPKKAVTVARESRPARDERGMDSRTSSGRASAESRDEQRPTAKHRDEQRPAPKQRDEQRPASKQRDEQRPAPNQRDEQRPAPNRRDEQRPAPKQRDEQRNDRRDERPASRGSRPQESRPGARADSRGSDRPPAAKAADAGRKSPSTDDEHWNELEGWVWDDESQRKPAAATRQMAADADVDDDEVEEIVQDAPAARADNEKEDAAPRRRGRRRGGRGRGRHEVAESAAPTADAAETTDRTVDFDIDFSEIMFDEDQEDFVSVSAGSVKAQRRIQDEPPSPAARESEPDDTDDEDEDGLDAEPSAAGESGPGRPRRGRRGRRGRGRGREESGEPVRAVERPAAAVRRPVRDEDNMDDDEDDDDELAVEDADLTDFGDPDDDEELPRRREGTRSEPARNERPPRSGQGRGYGQGQDDREPREPESTDRPLRQPTRDARSTREPQPTPDSQPERRPRPAREPRPAAASDEGETRRGPRPPIVAAEFQDIPTWEEAIGSLAIRTPSEEHARRTESRGRRDGGRPPRRRT